ncbi:MAG: hypothetical protein ACJAV1_001992, partial [Paraglaciecola sp.]
MSFKFLLGCCLKEGDMSDEILFAEDTDEEMVKAHNHAEIGF